MRCAAWMAVSFALVACAIATTFSCDNALVPMAFAACSLAALGEAER